MVEKINQKIKTLYFLALCLVIICKTSLCFADNSLRIIIDEETQTFLDMLFQPLFNNAHVPYSRQNIFIVEDPSLNAFVSDGNQLFIHTGTILAAHTPEEIQSVIAHEIGHITGGHILRQKLTAQELNNVSVFSTLIAGAAAIFSKDPSVALAVATGAHSSALNYYYTYRSAEERQADMFALDLLNRSQISSSGFLSFMQKLNQQNKSSGIVETDYFSTHPLTKERIDVISNNQNHFKNNPLLLEKMQIIQAKIYAYLHSKEQTLAKYPLSEQSITSQYAQAIAFYKDGQAQKALEKINTLILQDEKNPFFYEFKGQILQETGQIQKAIIAHGKALELLPSSAIFKLNYAHAVLQTEPSVSLAKEIIVLLNQALIEAPSSFGWNLLSQAYGYTNQEDYAIYATAQYLLHIGNIKGAQKQARLALAKTKSDSLKIKLEDILQDETLQN